MSTVTLCVGIPASGKSTWAREEAARTGAVIVCRDDIRLELGLKHGDSEQLVTVCAYDKIEEVLLYDQVDIIVADTNVNKSNRNRLIKFCTELGAEVQLHIFMISLEEAIRRDNNRPDSVGEEVIMRMHRQLENQHLR